MAGNAAVRAQRSSLLLVYNPHLHPHKTDTPDEFLALELP
jgi:hypothetical protein